MRVIERLGLTAYADRRAGTLSHGNAQRLGLAKALLHDPELLILDEPANGLDPAGIVEIRNLLLELAREQGVTVFMSSHILGEVSRLAQRIGIIHQGRLLQELDVDELERNRRRRLVVRTRDGQAAHSVLLSAGFPADITSDGSIEVKDPAAIERPDDDRYRVRQCGSPADEARCRGRRPRALLPETRRHGWRRCAMNTFAQAIWVETLKARRSRMPCSPRSDSRCFRWSAASS